MSSAIGLSNMLCALALIASAAAVSHTRDAGMCECYTRAHHGYRNPSCQCYAVAETDGVWGSLLAMLETEATQNSTTSACTCTAQAFRGFKSQTCTCDADFVPCPEHTSGHPTCNQDQGYAGVVQWNADAQRYDIFNDDGVTPLTKVPERPCPGNSTGWPFCSCTSGFRGTITWDSASHQYIGTCSLVDCPENAQNAPSCRCKKGFFAPTPLSFVFSSQTWAGVCNKIACTGRTNPSTHPDCSCELGFAGSSTWDSTNGVWNVNCNIVQCPGNAAHAGTSGVCNCNPGYTQLNDQLIFDFLAQSWNGSCSMVTCPINTNNNHPTCSCAVGYLGSYSWNATSETFAGQCALAPCPNGGAGASCACTRGYATIPASGPVWDATLGWKHTCNIVGCPEGANETNPTNCACDMPGYRGTLSWTGSNWGSCTSVPCPTFTTLVTIGGVRSCTLNYGYAGSVSWNGDWVPNVSAAPCPDLAECFTQSSRCKKGYAGTVTWNYGPQTYTSTCKAVSCPGNSRNHPECTCDAGFIGGSQGLLAFAYNGDASAYTQTCTAVNCPSNSNKVGDSSCYCNFGYTGTITWRYPGFDGRCVEATCPPNSSGTGPSCTCPQGYLASSDYSFSDQAWHGSCNKVACPGSTSEGWPSCSCIRGAKKQSGAGPSLLWSNTTGWDTTCVTVACPDNADGLQGCACRTGFATVVGNVVVPSGPSWDAASGSWTHTCERRDCPSGATTDHPNCMCRVGFRGNATWNAVTGSWSSCTLVGCNTALNQIRAYESQCVCRIGTFGMVSWDEKNQDWIGTCTPAVCPANVVCIGSEAACAKGYSGSVTWDASSSSWNASCRPVPCPANSTNFPDCKCDVGFSGGLLSWDGVNYGTCTFVPCPAFSTRTQNGNCVCNKFYTNTINWDGNSYVGNCTLAPCPASGGRAPLCACEWGSKPTTDFGWSAQAQMWTGLCMDIKCPDGCLNKTTNCTCKPGKFGTISWNATEFQFFGECVDVPCPAFSSGSSCTCFSGYTGLPTWSGTEWEHKCKAVDCPMHSTKQMLATGGYTCACNVGYSGSPAWTATQWDETCELVRCPEFSAPVGLNDLSSCVCQSGFTGAPKWNPNAQKYDSICVPATCPEPTYAQGSKCVCPRGYTGDCAWNKTTLDWSCTCATQECPSNAKFNAAIKFCTCNKGFTGSLSWNETADEYIGRCTKVPCTTNVANSCEHPNCICSNGTVGIVEWDDDRDVYTGSCTPLQCPIYSSNHPICSCDRGYRAANNFADPIVWNRGAGRWDGGCEVIPCPANSDGAPNCTCNKGYTPNGLDVQGSSWVGTCEKVLCPNNLGIHPDCNCTTGYRGAITWVQSTRSYTYGCTIAPCPQNAAGPLTCECQAGHSGFPSWQNTSQTWVHTCPQVECPPNSSGHPNCQCDSGYLGQISWNGATQQYEGNCTIVACPDGSRRRSFGTQNAKIIGCQCFTGCAGGYDWYTTNYTGNCECKSCPKAGDCTALLANPATLETRFTCTKGYSGSVIWDGANWIDECRLLECPENSAQHPSCACNVGFSGSVSYSSLWNTTTRTVEAKYTSTCTFVPCSDARNTRSVNSQGLPICTCPVGFSGGATWGSNQNFYASPDLVCREVSCPDSRMYKSGDLSKCICPVNSVGLATWSAGSQTYMGNQVCVPATCPNGVTCGAAPELSKCNQYYTGFYSWNYELQEWKHNCSVADCPLNSVSRSFVNNEPQGCMCKTGYSPSVMWSAGSQLYSGCETLAECPTNANTQVLDPVTNGRACKCNPGFFGIPSFSPENATFTHSCLQVGCLSGSTRDASSGLCNCSVGYFGYLSWNVADMRYDGGCSEAPCPSPGPVCGSLDAEKATLQCDRGYNSETVWNATSQAWVNKCVLVPCPINSVRINDSNCECKWGYAGLVNWTVDTKNYTSTCTFVSCPAPTTLDSSNHCVCPKATESGSCNFMNDDQWACTCSALVACRANSSGTVDCTCDVGFQGRVDLQSTTSTVDSDQTSTATFAASRSGDCTKLNCPVNSNGFPNCSCDSGYTGYVPWLPNTQQWNSSCALSVCPENAENSPVCSCKKGYLGTLTWDSDAQKWIGSCNLAPCPQNALQGFAPSGTPTCDCPVGYLGLSSWIFGTGWTHTCTLVNCPAFSEKITTNVVNYEALPNAIGCHDGTTSLGLLNVLQAETCSGNGDSCVAVAKQTCDAIASQGGDCWGFAVSVQWGIQVYSSQAVNKSLCDVTTGLLGSVGWTSYRREVSRVGDCRCLSGYAGGYSWQQQTYVGACTHSSCPENSDCTTFVDCRVGYKGQGDFRWDYVYEKWIGSCSIVKCPNNSLNGTFPACSCDMGFKGSISWNDTTEAWMGSCDAAPCPDFSDNNFPTCKCSKGYVRSDDQPNIAVGWSFAEQRWQQSCKPVDCPAFSERSLSSDCVCRIGYKGKTYFDFPSASYYVTEGSPDQKSCARVNCPEQSTDIGSTTNGIHTHACKCNIGYAGDLSWNPATYAWGTCTYVPCPAHSDGHPNCACGSGYGGVLNWNSDKYTGVCSELSTTPTWEAVPSSVWESGRCVRLQGPQDSTAISAFNPLQISFNFGGDATSVSVLRCDFKLDAEFTKVNGTFDVVPEGTASVKNDAIALQWNSSDASSSVGFIAVGTADNIVDPGMEMGSTALTYKFTQRITIPSSPVYSSNTIRIEISQPFGVSLRLQNFDFFTYNQPDEVVRCTRTTTAL